MSLSDKVRAGRPNSDFVPGGPKRYYLPGWALRARAWVGAFCETSCLKARVALVLALLPTALLAETKSIFLEPGIFLEMNDDGAGGISFFLNERGRSRAVGRGPYRIEDLRELAHLDTAGIGRSWPLLLALDHRALPRLGVAFAPLLLAAIATYPHHGAAEIATAAGLLEIYAFTPGALLELSDRRRSTAQLDKDVMYSVLNRRALVRGQFTKPFVRQLRSALRSVEKGRYRGCAPELRFRLPAERP